jgi:phosphatidylinositol glycan class Q protein
MGSVSIIFGFRGVISFSYDLAKLSMVHIQVIQRIFRLVLRVEISLFGSLWLLFRGKKKNVLRQRSDSLEYDFMQLLLGMILFAVCLFLFTTVLVYFTFFSMVHLLVTTSIGFLWMMHLLVTCFPLGDVILAICEPRAFSSKVFFSPMFSAASSCRKDVDTLVFRVETSSLNASWIILEAVKRGY